MTDSDPSLDLVMPRVGFGYDIHPLVPGRPLVLAGITIHYARGLGGHSDGDVLLHAICDSILGAAALGELGMLYPPGDPATKGIASEKLAKGVLKKLNEEGFRVLQFDATLVAQEPRLAPHVDLIKTALANIFELELSCVSIKIKSPEGLGSLGAAEGIAALSVATVIARKA